MADIETQLPQLGSTEQGVHVRAVAVHQPAAFVHDAAHFQYVGVEQAQRTGQRYHHAGQIISGQLAQRIQVGVAVSVGGQRYHVKAGHRGRRRVGSVGAVRYCHLRAPRVAASQMVGSNHEYAAKFAVGAGQRRQTGCLHPRDFGQKVLQSVK